jgi:two-component system chemotaxis response regulator CheY
MKFLHYMTAPLTPLRVLIVDDSSYMRGMLVGLFSKCGLEVAGVAGGCEEAIELYQKLRPDVVTLDIMMPGMDGLQALKGILAVDGNARVVIVSAIEHEQVVRQALDLGAIAFIQKPFSPMAMVERLKQVAEARAS